MAQTIDLNAIKERERTAWSSAAPAWRKHSTRTAATAAALTATLGLAGASWVVAVQQMNGMDTKGGVDVERCGAAGRARYQPNV